MAEVKLERVTKVYPNGFEAVSDLSLEVDDGEFMVLVGPSGCGKSTLLRMIAGLEDISSGVLRVDGRLLNDVRPGERDTAMIFQDYALYPHMTVAENISFPLRLSKVSSSLRRRAAEETADLLGLSDYLESKPDRLSGGQRQRVAMGRAMVRQPVVFLMDEPLSNLDAALRAHTRLEISELHDALAEFPYPPLTEAPRLLAVFCHPPLTEDFSLLASLPNPPLTEDSTPLAVL